MFTKIIFGIFEDKEYPVLIYLDVSEDNYESVVIRSMVNEYHLVQEIRFQLRDEAYTFIEMFNIKYANKFLLEKSYEVGVLDNGPNEVVHPQDEIISFYDNVNDVYIDCATGQITNF